jgi:hypothetical protein
MGRVDADDELSTSITGKRQFELLPLLHLPSRVRFFLCNLIVDPLADPDGALAHGRVRLGWLNRQKFGEYIRCLPIGHNTSQPRRQFHQLRRRPIGADFLQRSEGAHHARMAIPAQHPAGVANLHRAEDSSDAARRVILDSAERMAVRADPAKKGIGLCLMAHPALTIRVHPSKVTGLSCKTRSLSSRTSASMR